MIELGIDPKKPELAIAAMLWDNKQLADVVRATEPHQRRNAYNALKPHLRFKPLPLFMLLKKPKKELGLLVLTCQFCTKKLKIGAETEVDAAVKARDKGWKKIDNRTCCPKCQTQ